MSLDETSTGLKARSQRAAAYIRESRVRSSLFVIAMFLLATCQDQVFDWLPDLRQSDLFLVAPTWRELFTWDGLVTGFLMLWNEIRYIIGPWTLTPMLSYVTCVLAIAWLHSDSIRSAFARLGLSKPKRPEFTIPLVACVPSFAYLMFAYGPSEMLPDPEVFELTVSHVTSNVSGLLVGAFSVILTIGLLYRGLVESAGWTRILALVALALIPDLISISINGLQTFDLTPARFALLLLIGFVWLSASAWIFEQWSRRLWSLVTLKLGTNFTLLCLPWSDGDNFESTARILQSAPLVLLVIWTLWQTKSIDPRKLAQPA